LGRNRKRHQKKEKTEKGKNPGPKKEAPGPDPRKKGSASDQGIVNCLPGSDRPRKESGFVVCAEKDRFSLGTAL